MANKKEVYKLYHTILKEHTFVDSENNEYDEYKFSYVFAYAMSTKNPFTNYSEFYALIKEYLEDNDDHKAFYANTIVGKIYSYLPSTYDQKYNRIIQDMLICVFLISYMKMFERQPQLKENNCIAGYTGSSFFGNICSYNGIFKNGISTNSENYKDDYAKYGIRFNDLKTDNLCAMNNNGDIYHYHPDDFNAWVEYFISKYDFGSYFTSEELEVLDTYNMNGYECKINMDFYIKNGYQLYVSSDPDKELDYCDKLGLYTTCGTWSLATLIADNGICKYVKKAFNKDGGDMYMKLFENIFIYPGYWDDLCLKDTNIKQKYVNQYVYFIWLLFRKELYKVFRYDCTLTLTESMHPYTVNFNLYSDDLVPDNYWNIIRQEMFDRFDKSAFPKKSDDANANDEIEPTESQLLLSENDYISEASDKLEKKFDELLAKDLEHANSNGDPNNYYVSKYSVYTDSVDDKEIERVVRNNCYGHLLGKDDVKTNGYYSSYQTYNAIPPLSGQHGMLCNWNTYFRPIDTKICNGQGYGRVNGEDFFELSSCAKMNSNNYISTTGNFYDLYNTTYSYTQETAYCSGRGHLDTTYVSRAMPKYFQDFNSLTITLPKNFKSFTEGYIRGQVVATLNGLSMDSVIRAYFNDKMIYQRVCGKTLDVDLSPNIEKFSINFDFYMEAPIKNSDIIKFTMNGTEIPVNGKVFVEFCQQKP